MVCPRCKVEYREGFFTCADCKINLVNEVQEADTSAPAEDIQYIEILHIRQHIVLGLITSLFDAGNIRYFLLGGQMMNAGALSGGSPARLFVAEEDENDAKALLDTLTFEEDWLAEIL